MNNQLRITSSFLTLMLFALCAGTYAQTTVTGNVTDESGENLPGTSVLLLGTQQGAITDLNGNFSIAVADANTAVLRFSFLGMEEQNIPLNGRTKLNVRLFPEAFGAEEVVVIGYGTARKKDITGAVSSVRGNELNQVAAVSIDNLLQGRVAGLNITQNSAQPGGGISVNIRGNISTGSNAPLYVIDGIPMTDNSSHEPNLMDQDFGVWGGVDRNPLNSLNPSDVESIEVLKDAGAAAIYGSAAANGVILITTKRGKAGKPKVEYNGSYSIQTTKKYYELLNASEFREQHNRWSYEKWKYDNKIAPYGTVSEAESSLTFTAPFSAEEITNPEYNTDWLDMLLRNGQVNDQNISVSGGTENSRYYFSYNFYNNKAVLENSDFTRHSLRLNLDQTFSSYVKAGLGLSFSNVNNNNVSTGSGSSGAEKLNMLQAAYLFAPDVPVKDEEGVYSRSYNAMISNPASFLEITDKSEVTRITINPTVELSLLKELSFKAVGGFDRQMTSRNFYLPITANNYQLPDGMAQLSQGKADNYSAEGYFTYNNVFNRIHRLTAVAGVGWYKSESSGFGLQGVGFFTDAFLYNNVGAASDKEKEIINSNRYERVKLSQFFRVNYSFNDKYIVTVTGRNDGSSVFAANKKWGFFPSGSVAWRVSEESFMQADFVSDLKIRAGVGTSGNESFLGSNSLTLYSANAWSPNDFNYYFGSNAHTGVVLASIENKNLTWETDVTTNIGIDFGFFRQRLSGSFELYRRTAKDLLDSERLPSNNPVGSIAKNVGSRRSEGVELTIKSRNIDKPDFKWETDFNISYMETSWVERNPEVALADYIDPLGKVDVIYGWKTDGLIRNEEDIPAYMPNATVGNIIYADNGDGELNSGDVTELGHWNPRWNMGFNNTIYCKGFDFTVYFYGLFDFMRTRGFVPSVANLYESAPGNTLTSVKTEVWASDSPTGFFPGVALDQYSGNNPTGQHDYYLQDASFVRLQNITLGYTLPEKLLKSKKIFSSVRFYIDLKNIATFTKYKGFDPELGSDNPYPQYMTTSIGVSVTF